MDTFLFGSVKLNRENSTGTRFLRLDCMYFLHYKESRIHNVQMHQELKKNRIGEIMFNC